MSRALGTLRMPQGAAAFRHNPGHMRRPPGREALDRCIHRRGSYAPRTGLTVPRVWDRKSVGSAQGMVDAGTVVIGRQKYEVTHRLRRAKGEFWGSASPSKMGPPR